MAAEEIRRLTVPFPKSKRDEIDEAARQQGLSTAAYVRTVMYRELRNRAANITLDSRGVTTGSTTASNL